MLNSTRKPIKDRALTVKWNIRHNVLLINRVSNEEYRGDIVGEDTIDGKGFYIVATQPSGRLLKLAKEGWDVKR